MANEQSLKRVLYVEASDLVQASHPPAIIERLNCVVIQVHSAKAALDALSQEDPFDLILVGDVSKPVQDKDPEPELSVIRRARQQDARVPILLFTSHNYMEAAYRTGATDHLLKPAGVLAVIDFLKPYLSGTPNERPRSQTDSSGGAN
jgi:CheY-like chemotaxis protein